MCSYLTSEKRQTPVQYNILMNSYEKNGQIKTPITLDGHGALRYKD